MVVIAIIGILGSVAIFSMRGYGDSQNPAATARAIQLAMFRARTAALADGAQRRLTCTTSGCTYQMATTRGMSTPAAWTDSGNNVDVGNHATIWSISSSTDAAVDGSAGTQMGVSKTIRFFPDGSADPVTVYICDLNKQHKFKIYVYPGTGLARLVSNW